MPSFDATTSAAGSPRAISSAKLGPDSTPTRAPGRLAAITSTIVAPVPGSSPFDAHTTIGAPPAVVDGAAARSVSRDVRRRDRDNQHVPAGDGAADVARHRDLRGQAKARRPSAGWCDRAASASAAARSISHSATS